MLGPRAFGVVPLGLLLLGCPSNVAEPSPRAAPIQVDTPPDDPRVVAVDGELYARAKKGEGADRPDPGAGRNPGSGAPDESNGVCRLFAPKLPEPECCEAEWGFDVETAAKACGHDAYLGESFYMSCGYYFHSEDGKPRWFRLSGVPGGTPADAARSHDRKVQRLYEDPAFASTPVPGVPGALWSHKDGLNWAFLPGWSMVRLFSWKDDSCSREGIVELIKVITAAKQPPSGAERLGLVPLARK